MNKRSFIMGTLLTVALTVFGGVRKPNYDKSKIAPYVLEDPAKLLTFDQHLLLASIAPRALLVEGYDEPWFDTEGEYLACRAAAPVWKFLGKGTMPDRPYPSDYDTSCIGPSLGYVRRDLWHGHAYCDWLWLLDFADRHCAVGTHQPKL